MQQRWWLVGVAGVGIVLALLLVPRPDTGGELPPPVDPDLHVDGPATPSPNPAPNEPGPRRASRGGEETERPSADELSPVPSPAAQEHWEKRNAPIPTAAREIVAPWGAIRREMVLAETDEGQSLIAKIAPPQAQLVAIGNLRDDGSADLASIVRELDSVAAEVKSSSFADNPMVATSIQRYESARDRWQASN